MKSYWNGNGKFQTRLNDLHALIDHFIETKGRIPARLPELERLRKMKNAYYRLFNDGDPNVRLLGVSRDMIPTYKTWGPFYTSMWNVAQETADRNMDTQIARAWAEYLIDEAKELAKVG